MQDRMQGDSKLMELAYAGVFGTLFPLFLFAARSFSRRSRGFEIAEQVANAFMELRPKYLDAVKANLSQITGLSAAHPEVDRLARSMVRRHACAWVDFFYFGQRDPREAIRNFRSIEGAEHLLGAVEAGKGAILLTAHAGNFELGGLLLRSKGLEVHTVYKPDRFEAVERLRNRIRAQGGVVGIPVGGTGFATLPLLKLLREGRLVGMQGDRDFSLTGLSIPFFGREAFFPRGPWELAAMTGAPILSSFIWLDEEHHFHGRFSAPIFIEGKRGERQQAIEAGMRRYVAELEALIRQDPSQWYCFYPFWDDPARTAQAVAP
ncbi:MAG TPA: lysophospholipid acyltransferase family protein [Holophagaceae bacterium]|nr:lysophospholipid acyltransferase family protein [Holophagaceae bacterium]